MSLQMEEPCPNCGDLRLVDPEGPVRACLSCGAVELLRTMSPERVRMLDAHLLDAAFEAGSATLRDQAGIGPLLAYLVFDRRLRDLREIGDPRLPKDRTLEAKLSAFLYTLGPGRPPSA